MKTFTLSKLRDILMKNCFFIMFIRQLCGLETVIYCNTKIFTLTDDPLIKRINLAGALFAGCFLSAISTEEVLKNIYQ